MPTRGKMNRVVTDDNGTNIYDTLKKVSIIFVFGNSGVGNFKVLCFELFWFVIYKIGVKG